MLYKRLKTETANQRHQKFDVKRSNLYLFPKRFEQQTTSRQIAIPSEHPSHHCKQFFELEYPLTQTQVKKQIKYIHPENWNHESKTPEIWHENI